jgi:hypothetical protein
MIEVYNGYVGRTLLALELPDCHRARRGWVLMGICHVFSHVNLTIGKLLYQHKAIAITIPSHNLVKNENPDRPERIPSDTDKED